MQLKERTQMDPAYQWDFRDIYESREAWEEAYAVCEKAIPALDALISKMTESKEDLRTALDEIYRIDEMLSRVYVYASLHKEADNGCADYQEMEGRAMNLYVAFSTAIAPFDPTLLACDEEKIRSYIADESLKTYRFSIEDTLRSKPHILDRAGETILSKLSDAASSPRNTFSMLESVDMSFPKIKNADGEEVEITHGTFGLFRESGDRRVREEAFQKYFGEFNRYRNTFAALYANSVKLDCFYADVRGYESACHGALERGNIPMSVYDSLIDAIHSGLPTMKRYLALRGRALGLDELHMYDLYCPMVDEVEYTVTFPESRAILKNALAPLGEEYAALLDRAYDEKWMDVYENKGKTTGAFSCGIYGVHPYVLLNYTNTLDDLFTVAHELGHAMHSYFSNKTQDYVNHNYRIMVAEVASTVNEVLLTRYLLKTETEPRRRAYILNHFLEGFRTTVFRQTLFAEFERKAHEMYASGQPLTAKSLSELYRSLNELYYEGAVVDEFSDIEWARIPHFYNAFYVYQYATGFSSAVAIADSILKTGDASDYLRFLCTGGSDYPLNELKIAGVDLTRSETVREALSVFDASVSEMTELFDQGDLS